MTTRERFRRTMAFQPVDRAFLFEFAPWWDQTVERWKNEGLRIERRPPLNEFQSLLLQFGLDLHLQSWISVKTRETPQPKWHGAPLCGTIAEYERIRPTLYPEPAVNAPLLRTYAEYQARGEAIVWITLDGPFWGPRGLLGIEPHLYAFYDQPELMHRMNEDIAEFNLRAIRETLEILTPDFMTFAEDMSYNHGPMLSEAMFDEFLLPYYRRMVPPLRERGVRVIIDSDGDVTEAIPWFQRAGAEGILPLERQAGVDLAKLREAFPDFLFLGHYDKMVMPKGEAAMRAEFERLLPLMRRGGFLLSVDHQTPPGVSLSQYETYVKLYKEYAGACDACGTCNLPKDAPSYIK